MPFGKYESPKPEPTPTFFQFLKTASKGIESKTRFHVDIVWMPGKFNNITLQTHAFRYICDENHPLYPDMQEYIQNQSGKDVSPRLSIVVDSIEDRTIDLTEDPKIKGRWEKLGATAFRYKNP